MPFGKSSTMDFRRSSSSSSSSQCSTATLVVFVALCLVGVWMMTSSTVVPVDMSATEINSEMKQQASETYSAPLEESSTEVSGEATRRDADTSVSDPTTETKSESSEEQKLLDKTAENMAEKTQEGELGEDGKDKKDDDSTKAQAYSDENGNTEGEEVIKEGGERKEGDPENAQDRSSEENPRESANGAQENTADQQTYSDENGTAEGGEMIKEGGQENSLDKSREGSSQETTDGEQEKKADQKFDETTESEQDKSPEQSSDETTNGDEKPEGAEMIKEGVQEYGQDKSSTEEPYQVTTDGEQEKKADQKVNETADGEQNKISEQNSDEAKGDEQQKSDSNNTSEQDGKDQGQIEEKGEQNEDKEAEVKSNETITGTGNKTEDSVSSELFPDGAQSELLNETARTQNDAWSTQAAESKKEKEVQATPKEDGTGYNWKLCNVSTGPDYIPCLDNEDAIKKLKTTKHYEHRERHCPDEAPTCLLPLPEGYKQPIEWPNSRNKIWYHNVPHTELATIKGHQNWVKVSGEYLTFPGGGTQFKHGALHYIDFIQESVPEIAWGQNSRVVLDVGCGVASFGGYLFDRDVLTMSFAPKDEHEAQVQFALERGIPAFSAVMGTKRLPFPGIVFDVIHCARCRVPWHIEGGMLLLELNRLLRPGGYFVWSATPVYQKLEEDVEIWNAMTELTKSMCWEMVNKTKDKINKVGIVTYRKPSNNECYAKRSESSPPLCQGSDDPNAAWNVPLQACMHEVPLDSAVRGSQWPQQWPQRSENPPYWLNSSQIGVYGKPAPQDFKADFQHWKRVVSNSYLKGLGIDWSGVRNVMDMRAVYGGFAAALQEVNAWVMNIVTIDSPDTLPVIYERGLFGMYHDWCESFSTYPRSYDLLHADHLFSKTKKRCKLLPVIAEVDRILRPQGKLIVRDNAETLEEVESMAKSLNWEVRMGYSKEKGGLLCVQKTLWRPEEVEATVSSLS
ncbi:probable methyltransferase PMT24 [Musa acuminata AAA Group]|uniref:probable methyltransferase PMT24 n=1 Tax=Musa acuminata AAA Group TaxID=214697 RepID=UPI0031D1603E